MHVRSCKAVAVLIMICLAFTCSACSLKGIAEGLDNNTENMEPGTDVSTGGTVDADISGPEISETDDNTASMGSWSGDYSFTEFAPPDQNMFYSISIYEEKGSYYADIYIDGFQTMMRLKARASENADRLDLFFDSYLPDNLMEIHDEGDYLLSLEKSGSKLLTHWGGIEPMLSDNSTDSGEYFDKAE